MRRFVAAFTLAAAAALNAAEAAQIAIFGDNNINSFLTGTHSTTLVDSAWIEANSLDTFDLFIYTRDDDEFGESLSAAAAAKVKAFVTGNIVLFTSDLQDGGFNGTDDASKLLIAAVDFAGNKGYIGELVGACAAMESNNFNLAPLGLIQGACDYPTFVLDDSGSAISGDPMTILMPTHPVVQGVQGPLSLDDRHENFAKLTGVQDNLIIAVNLEGIPSIVGSPVRQQIPEPGSLALLGLGLALLGLTRRSRQDAVQPIQTV